MNMYHFLKSEFGLSDIRERRLKVSRIDDLNDPFEFLAVETSDAEFRKNLNASIAALNDQFGLICFSKSWQNPVQWSHYADRHRRICLGFEIPPNCLDRVQYRSNRMRHNGVLNEAQAKQLLCTKYKQWSYEAEYRAFVPLDSQEGDLYYTDFDLNLRLTTVIVGAKSDVSRTQVRDALGDISGTVDIFKARPAFTCFKIVRNRDECLWI